MRFQTPQFIEVEDKILGPLSIRQFVYMVGGVGMAYTAYKALPRVLDVLVALAVLGLAGCLAFVKINNRPFIFILKSFLIYIKSSRLYVWKKPEPVPKNTEPTKEIAPELYIPRLSTSKLKDLAWSLDIQEKVKPEEN